MKRPVTTLFMLVSVDGKISTGADDTFDVDSDYLRIAGLREGLHQYYEIEQTTDIWSLNTGRTQAKLGVNEKAFPQKTDVNFVVLDNTHLTEHGVRYFCSLSREFVLITQNASHPAFKVKEDNLHIELQKTSQLSEALNVLYQKYGCGRVTVQTGGTVNGMLLREKLFDYVDIVVAPVLIGGRGVPTLIDGEPLSSANNLDQLGVLELIDCTVLKNSYLRLRYSVRKDQSSQYMNAF